MDLHSTNVTVQEHGCGILAAMSLRQPHNATIICKATNGAEVVLLQVLVAVFVVLL